MDSVRRQWWIDFIFQRECWRYCIANPVRSAGVSLGSFEADKHANDPWHTSDWYSRGFALMMADSAMKRHPGQRVWVEYKHHPRPLAKRVEIRGEP